MRGSFKTGIVAALLVAVLGAGGAAWAQGRGQEKSHGGLGGFGREISRPTQPPRREPLDFSTDHPSRRIYNERREEQRRPFVVRPSFFGR